MGAGLRAIVRDYADHSGPLTRRRSRAGRISRALNELACTQAPPPGGSDEQSGANNA